MRLFVLLLAALVAQPAVAAKKKKPAASAKKAPKPAKPVEPEPAPVKAAAKKSTVLLDTNPAAVASQLEATLAEAFNVGVADTALPEDVDHDAVMKAAKKSRAVAVVTARYSNGVWQLRTWSGTDGGVLADVTFKGPKEGRVTLPKPTLARLLTAAMKAEASATESTNDEVATATPARPASDTKPADAPKKSRTKEKPPPEEATDPKAPAEAVETPAPAASSDGEKPQGVHLGAGVRMANRHLSYTDDLFGALSRYSSPLAPSIAIEAELFPGALFSNGIASWFGLAGAIDFLVGVTAVAADGTRYASSALRVKASVMARIPIADRLELGILFGYALTTYAIAGDPAVKPNVPDVAYSALRPGASFAVRMVGPLFVKIAGGYQILLSTGQLGSAEYFPRQKGGGLDVQGGLVLRPVRFFEARASFDYQHYWFSMNPEPGDPYIAGGALDDAVGFTVAVAFTL